MLDWFVLGLIIIILLAINGFFVAAEFAIAAVPATRIAQLAEAGSPAARRVQQLLRSSQRMNRYLSTAQSGITLASLGLGMYGEHAFAELLLPPLSAFGWISEALAHTIATVFAVAALTFLHVVLGEMAPKSLALQSAEGVAIALSSAMSAIERLLWPLTTVLNWLGAWALRLIGIPLSEPAAGLTSSLDLEYIVEESSEKGLLQPAQQIFVENVIDFAERTIAQVMTPRTRIVALPVEATLEKVLITVREHHFSRYPVYAQDRDNIIGVLHIKDLARFLVGAKGVFNLQSMIREIQTVPETMPLDKMLEIFRRKQVQIAIAIDEFGGTAGLVTLEDLAEELIGEIHDEFDSEEIVPVSEIDATHLRLRGDLLLAELDQLYGLDLATDEADTIGGLIMAKLGRAAQPGDAIELNAELGVVRFEVEATERFAISTVLAILPNMKRDEVSPPVTETGTTAADAG